MGHIRRTLLHAICGIIKTHAFVYLLAFLCVPVGRHDRRQDNPGQGAGVHIRASVLLTPIQATWHPAVRVPRRLHCLTACQDAWDTATPCLRLGLAQGESWGHVQGQSSWTTLYPAWGASYQTTSAGTAPLDVRLTPNDGGPPLVSTYALLAL